MVCIIIYSKNVQIPMNADKLVIGFVPITIRYCQPNTASISFSVYSQVYDIFDDRLKVTNVNFVLHMIIKTTLL